MVQVVGINHKTTSVDIREKLCFSSDDALLFMKHLLSVTDICGVVIVSTCNRTELYFLSGSSDIYQEVLREWLFFKKINNEINYYHLQSDDCVRHLFSVASGLDSIVIGEYQILGQVKDAYRLSTQNDCSAPELSHLFHKAFEAGKKIQNLKLKSQAPISTALAAVDMMNDFFQYKKDARIIVLGAGIMANNVIISLIDSGFKNIQLFNRSEERARNIKDKFAIEFGRIEDLSNSLQHTDVLYCTTSALYPIVFPEHFVEVKKKILCFDMGLPRNIHPSVGELKQVSLFDLDHIKADYISDLYNTREINEIFSSLLMDFNNWISARNLTPVIRQFQSRFDSVLEQRLLYLKNKISEREYDLIRDSGEFLRDKFLSGIIAGFIEHTGYGRDLDFLKKLQKAVEN